MIVVGGEALVDLVPAARSEPSGTTALADLSPRLGGGPYNVAIALALLDTRVAFLSRVSEDAFGRALVDRLDSSGVDLSLLQRGQEPTTLAVVGLGEDGSARYTFYVEGTADRVVADPGPLPAEVRAVCLGTLGMVLEPGASRYEDLLRRESARGTLVALDPNIRAEMIEDAAAYRRRFLGWLPDVGLLKLSVEDAAWLAGVELGADPEEGLSSVVAAAREWRRAGPAAVVLTLGGDGLLALTGDDEVVRVPGVPVEVVDTIGAGDTVCAALLAWLEDRELLSPDRLRAAGREEWEGALGFAARAAAITCSRPGAQPPRSGDLAGWRLNS